MNTISLDSMLKYHDGRTRLASSYGRDPDRGGTWFGLRPAPTRRKRILLEPGELHIMADTPGSGMVTRLFMTTLLPFNALALRDLVLRFYWDGEAHPSVECPFGDFFGAPFGAYRAYNSAPLSITAGAFNSAWPMPFGAGARLTVTNEGTRVVDPLYYHVTYSALPDSPPNGLRFHAQWRREELTQLGRAYTLLDARGRGHYVGCHLFMQNREWWLRLPIRDMILPYGMGMGMLEGWETIFLEGESEPYGRGTGTEDYFSGAWYYSRDGIFYAPDHGCTVRDYVRGRIAVYRFDLASPVPFQKEIQVRIDHGFENSVRADYTNIAYWYQDEPHMPFEPLPLAPARRAISPLPNLAQAALLFGVPAAGLFALLARAAGTRHGQPRS